MSSSSMYKEKTIINGKIGVEAYILEKQREFPPSGVKFELGLEKVY